MKHTTKEVNSTFKIKVNGVFDGKKINILVGCDGLERIINDTNLVDKFLDRAFSSMADKCECKLRRGIKVTFYVH